MNTIPSIPTQVPSPKTSAEIERQRLRRRTFAIISHPDAGKTTLTEKLLLFGNSIEIAGAVRGRKSERTATSDWMELEKERGISISSTALTFEFAGFQVNLLDTPGHHDFSEDTYRTLMAADAAVMVIDLAKGIEAQTEKLFRVCALRKIPVLTFVNKVDRQGRSPLEIIDEIERKFSIEPVPQNWPLGSGDEFRGFVDLQDDSVHLFDERRSSSRISPRIVSWGELASIEPAIRPELIRTAGEEVELVRMAGATLETEQFLGGSQTPVFFGSALTNFGIEHFLHGFLRLCPPPGSREAGGPQQITDKSSFSGFVFKIQANLDPRHRDRVAFLRVCSGMFERNMEVTIARSRKKIRLARAFRLFGQDRQTLDEAWPGDIIGLICPGELRLGDTLCENEIVHHEGLPQFSPEFFAVLNCTDTAKRKQFDRGLQQLVEEGAIQVFHDPKAKQREFLLAAVGELQFDVVRFRLESEYNAPTSLSWRPYKLARWYELPDNSSSSLKLPSMAKLALDQFGNKAVLLHSEWDEKTLHRLNPEIRFEEIRVTSEVN